MQDTATTTNNSTATTPDADAALTRFQLDALAAVANYDPDQLDDVDPADGDHPHGLAIKDLLEQRLETQVHHGRLYPNLDDLVDRGYLDKITVDRRTNAYRLTDDGQAQLAQRAAWLNAGITDGDSA